MLAPCKHAKFHRFYLAILLVGSYYMSTVRGDTHCNDQVITIVSPQDGDNGGIDFDQAAPEAALLTSFTVGVCDSTGGFCSFAWTWTSPNGDT